MVTSYNLKKYLKHRAQSMLVDIIVVDEKCDIGPGLPYPLVFSE